MTTQEPPPAPKKPRRRSRRSKPSPAARVLILRRVFAAEALRSALCILTPRGDLLKPPPDPLTDRFLVAKATDLVNSALCRLRLILRDVGVGFSPSYHNELDWIGNAPTPTSPTPSQDT